MLKSESFKSSDGVIGTLVSSCCTLVSIERPTRLFISNNQATCIFCFDRVADLCSLRRSLVVPLINCLHSSRVISANSARYFRASPPADQWLARKLGANSRPTPVSQLGRGARSELMDSTLPVSSEVRSETNVHVGGDDKSSPMGLPTDVDDVGIGAAEATSPAAVPTRRH